MSEEDFAAMWPGVGGLGKGDKKYDDLKQELCPICQKPRGLHAPFVECLEWEDKQRRIRAAELADFPDVCDSDGRVIKAPFDPDHCLDDAVKLAEACGLKAELRTPSGNYPATARVWSNSSEWGIWVPDPSLTRALTSAVLRAMEEKGGSFADLGPVNITDGEPSEDYIRRLRDGGEDLPDNDLPEDER